MTKTQRALALIAVLTLPAPFPGCAGTGRPFEDRLPTSEEVAVEVEPQELSFTHTVGESPCPQLVGRLTIRNRGTSPFTTDVRLLAGAPLSFGPDQTVLPGQSVTVDVFFTCTGQTDFSVTGTVLRPQDGSDDNATNSRFTVRGTIVRRTGAVERRFTHENPA
jgi:hypothetical protein